MPDQYRNLGAEVVDKRTFETGSRRGPLLGLEMARRQLVRCGQLGPGRSLSRRPGQQQGHAGVVRRHLPDMDGCYSTGTRSMRQSGTLSVAGSDKERTLPT